MGGQRSSIYWYVNGMGWFVVKSRSKTAVRKLANEEYGRSQVQEIRAATDEEVNDYVRLKGLKDAFFIEDLDY